HGRSIRRGRSLRWERRPCPRSGAIYPSRAESPTRRSRLRGGDGYSGAMTDGNHNGVPVDHREKQQHETEEMDARVVQELPPHLIVIFGATGDLAKRKLLPGMLRLFQSELMPEFRVLGTSIEEIGNEEWREIVRSACDEFSRFEFS